MIKQMALGLTCVAVGGVVAGSVAATGSGAVKTAGGETTVMVTARPTEQRFVDTGREGPSQGDMFVFSADLYQHGERAGRAGVVCTVTSRPRDQVLCDGNAALGGSQIAVQAFDRGTQRFPVVGGTGKFRGVGGVLEVRELRGDRERWVFHLTR